jgi:hypothetical protein
MKSTKLFFTVFIAILMNSLIYAQTIRFGISAGLNSSALYDDNINTYYEESRGTSFNMRAHLEVPLISVFSLQSGVQYYQFKNKIKLVKGIPNASTVGDHNFNYTYLVVPVKIKYKDSSFLGIYLFSGGEFDYLLSAKEETNYGASYDIKDKMNEMNMSFLIGAGIEKEIWKINLFIEFGYILGLTDISKEDYLTNAKIDGFNLNFGILF